MGENSLLPYMPALILSFGSNSKRVRRKCWAHLFCFCRSTEGRLQPQFFYTFFRKMYCLLEVNSFFSDIKVQYKTLFLYGLRLQGAKLKSIVLNKKFIVHLYGEPKSNPFYWISFRISSTQPQKSCKGISYSNFIKFCKLPLASVWMP